jgi:membrane protein implicated in regulation of membrane protease activity
VFFLLAIGLLVVLPSPWGLTAFLVCLVLGCFEAGYWWRRMRGNPAEVGAETLIGKQASVVVACRPLGQVAVAGERWEARCDAGADIGDVVTVVGRDELLLIVAPAA